MDFASIHEICTCPEITASADCDECIKKSISAADRGLLYTRPTACSASGGALAYFFKLAVVLSCWSAGLMCNEDICRASGMLRTSTAGTDPFGSCQDRRIETWKI